MYKLCFYVAEEYLAPVKSALFAAGAGSYDGFKHCCWQTRGDGQYQPESEALVQLTEYKVEIYCEEQHLEKSLLALKAAHPCDDPAYDFYKVNK